MSRFYERVTERIGHHKCWYCGCDTIDPPSGNIPRGTKAAPNWHTRDHIVPSSALSKLSNTLAKQFAKRNIIPACNFCNMGKQHYSYRAFTESNSWGRKRFPDLHQIALDVCDGYKALMHARGRDLVEIREIYEMMPYELLAKLKGKQREKTIFDILGEIVDIVFSR